MLLSLAPPACTRAPADSTTQPVTIAGRHFDLELALDDAARYRGLSFREQISPTGGMLFVFPSSHVGVQYFVMRDCPVPIDIIFLDPTGVITAMHEMQVEPLATRHSPEREYDSKWPAQFVIELRGGTLRELHLREGQKLDLPLEPLKQRAH